MCAAVVEYEINRDKLGALGTLAFVFPEFGWHDFVKNCRTGTFDHKGPGTYYDIVYGPIYTIAYETGTAFEQVSFHSVGAIGELTFVRVRRGTPWFR